MGCPPFVGLRFMAHLRPGQRRPNASAIERNPDVRRHIWTAGVCGRFQATSGFAGTIPPPYAAFALPCVVHDSRAAFRSVIDSSPRAMARWTHCRADAWNRFLQPAEQNFLRCAPTFRGGKGLSHQAHGTVTFASRLLPVMLLPVFIDLPSRLGRWGHMGHPPKGGM